MATYFDWARRCKPVRPVSSRAGWTQTGRRHRLTYVSGNEPRLREIVVQASASHADPNERLVLVADGTNDGAIWDVLNTYPALTERKNPALAMGEKPTREKPGTVPVFRHITVREAHLIKNWDSLPGWLEDMRQVSVTFDSEREDFREELWGDRITCSRRHVCKDEVMDVIRTTTNARDHRWCARCEQVRDLIVKTSTCILVMAHSPTTDLQKAAAAEMVKAYAAVPTTSTPVSLLLSRTEDRIGLALEALDKLNAVARVNPAQGELTTSRVRIAEEGSEITSFERGLWQMNRRRAATAAADVNPDDVPRMFDRLDDWLGAAVRARGMVKAGRSRYRIQQDLRINWYMAGRVLQHASRYTDEDVANAIEALAMADQAWAAGHRVGVLEELASRW